MNEQNTQHLLTTSTATCERTPAGCQVEVLYTGKDGSALDAAKEILIASYVKNMINKGNFNTI